MKNELGMTVKQLINNLEKILIVNGDMPIEVYISPEIDAKTEELVIEHVTDDYVTCYLNVCSNGEVNEI